METVAERIKDTYFEPYFDEIYQLESENSFLRVLNQNLKKPTIKLKSPLKLDIETVRKSCLSVLDLMKVIINMFRKIDPAVVKMSKRMQFNSMFYRALWRNDARYRESLMSISLCSDDTQI